MTKNTKPELMVAILRGMADNLRIANAENLNMEGRMRLREVMDAAENLMNEVIALRIIEEMEELEDEMHLL